MGDQKKILGAVQARLLRVAASRDLSPVLEPGAITEAHRLAETLSGGDGDLQALHMLGWLHWYRFQALPEGRGHEELQAAIAMFVPCFLADPEEVPGPLLPTLADEAAPVTVAYLRQALGSTDPALLSSMAGLCQHILDATPADHPDLGSRLSNLAAVLYARFGLTRAQADLDTAIEVSRAAVDVVPPAHPDRPGLMNNLGGELQARFRLTGAQADLDAAIESFRAAVGATPAADPNRSARLSNLGSTLQDRFERTGAWADLEAAIELGRAALDAASADQPGWAACLDNLRRALHARYEQSRLQGDLDTTIETLRVLADVTPADHPGRAEYLDNLTGALHARYGQARLQGDLNKAILDLRVLVGVTPAGHPDRAGYLDDLGSTLYARFEPTGAQADLDAAIQSFRAAVDATQASDPDWPMRVNNLGSALLARSRRTAVQEDLDSAIDTLRAAVDATPSDHASLPMRLSNLSAALQTRFGRTGAQADLDSAVEVGRAAVKAAPASHPDLSAYLSNLGGALYDEFRRTGAQADVDSSIEVSRAAVEAAPVDHADLPMYLSNLGTSLLGRFRQIGAQADLDDAVEVCRAAVEAAPVGHPERSRYLSSLGSALQARFQRAGAQADLDAVIQNYRSAVDAVPASHPELPLYLNNLGAALQARFYRTEEQEDLDAAIEAGRAAVDAIPADHPDRPGCLSNLGNVLRTRFLRTGVQSDLDTAIEVGSTAADAAPADHPDRPVYLSNLGKALYARFRQTGAQADLEAAVSALGQAVNVSTAPPSIRIQAGRDAAALVALSDSGRAADLLEAAVLLLPELAPRQLDRSDQEYAIGRFAGLGGEAAALVLADPAGTSQQRAWRALRLLEAGRAVLVGQVLDTRSDLTDLRQCYPDLAARFASLRAQLDQAPAVASGMVTLGDSSATDRMAEDRRSLAGQLATTLAQIRAQPGFSSFALPPATGELLAQAAEGPIVTFNISRYRSDALLLTTDGITALELPNLTQDALARQVMAFLPALHAVVTPGADRAGAQATIREILAWLWDTAAGPVLTALGHTAAPAPDAPWPRVWWATGGLLSLLPLHAAGHHSDPPGLQHTVMDRVISSYTPTVRALSYARQHASPPPGGLPNTAGQALIVAMPTTPGLPGRGHLPSVRAETDMLRALLHQPVVLIEPATPGSDPAADEIPTRANVLARLPDAAIAHFSCHGAINPADPSQSQLLLYDDPLTVACLAPVNLDHAQLAYLSACDTALSLSVELLDEAIHLTAAFQLAGFPHVIGTLWAVSDQPALTVAASFYTHLLTSHETLDTSRAAHALHHAVRAARTAHPAIPSLWAAYLHAGA